MEQEINNIIDLINNALESLPEIGSQAWELMVSGTRIQSIISVTISLIVITVCSLLIITIIKRWSLLKNHGVIINSDSEEGKILCIIVLSLIIFVAFFILVGSILPIVAPEYSIIKQLLMHIK